MPGIIVCVDSRAADAGAKVQEGGGNAFDAAITAAFVQMVVSPFACGLDEGVPTKVGSSLSRNDGSGADERITLTLILSHRGERKGTSAPHGSHETGSPTPFGSEEPASLRAVASRSDVLLESNFWVFQKRIVLNRCLTHYELAAYIQFFAG